MIDLDDLKKKAEAATPGPWEATQHGNVVSNTEALINPGKLEPFRSALRCTPTAWVDADFIAAANPAVVLELIEQLKAAQALAAANIGKLNLQPRDIVKVQVPPAQFSKYWIGGYAIEQLRAVVPRDCEVLIYPVGADIERMEASAIRAAGWVRKPITPYAFTGTDQWEIPHFKHHAESGIPEWWEPLYKFDDVVKSSPYETPKAWADRITKSVAAEKTLQSLGYTYHGGSLWKPPLGNPPDYVQKAGTLEWVTLENGDRIGYDPRAALIDNRVSSADDLMDAIREANSFVDLLRQPTHFDGLGGICGPGDVVEKIHKATDAELDELIAQVEAKGQQVVLTGGQQAGRASLLDRIKKAVARYRGEGGAK
jgi:hypothetical protein